MARPRRRRTIGELTKTPEGRAELEKVARPLSRRVALVLLRLDRRLFLETGSALYAWRAWKRARRHEIDTPRWVAEYLDAGAERLLRLAETQIEKEEDRPKLAARALSLFEPGSGRGSSLSRFALMERNLDGVAAMRAALEGGASLAAAARAEAKRSGKSARTWENAYRDLAPLFDVDLGEL